MSEPVRPRLLDDAQRLAWLRLIRTDNVGPRTFRVLLNQFGGAAAALDALPALAARGGGGPSRVYSAEQAEREIAALTARGGHLVALGEPDYPPMLARADGAPPLLAMIGRSELIPRPMIALVGARDASAAGRSFAGRLARELGEAGYVIVSGLARGIDAAAHEASLATGTVAVVAGGLDRIYPPEHEDLFGRIARDGLAVSEMPMGWSPRGKDFPRRNRIIAGLALGTVVAEAALRSGSLITARLALEANREVMAAPGSPLDPRCEGSNRLIREGATLITSAAEVIEALPRSDWLPEPAPVEEPEPSPAPVPEPDADERRRIQGLLGPSPVEIDELVRLSGAPARAVQIVLLELELAGRLERHTGGRVRLIPD
ncbi:MAG TPA: DNA-processing protein DprA [Hyphomicrobiales bacterium]|nr:DNA-processing protein DprA [Hyphomicrobiales bacterium]